MLKDMGIAVLLVVEAAELPPAMNTCVCVCVFLKKSFIFTKFKILKVINNI